MTVDLPLDWREQCAAWAQRTNAVRELWLFGSRGPKGGATAASDVDLALVLMPLVDGHNWAYGAYCALVDDVWQPELERIVGRHVSLEAIEPGTEEDHEVRSTGICLWRR